MTDKTIYIPCMCGCCTLEVSKLDLVDLGYPDLTIYDICVLDSRYDHNANGLLGRLRMAAMSLLGKPGSR